MVKYVGIRISQFGNPSSAKALARLSSGFRPSIKLPCPIRALLQHNGGKYMLMLRPAAVKNHLGIIHTFSHVLRHNSSYRAHVQYFIEPCITGFPNL